MTRFLWRVGLLPLLVCGCMVLLAGVVGRALPAQGTIAYMALDRRGARVWTLDPRVGVTLSLADHAFTGPPMFPSPDGQQLAFFRETGGNAQLHIVNVDGSHLRQLPNVTPDLAIAWMPDSRHIRISSVYGTHKLFDVLSLEQSTLPRLEVTGCGLPVLSPDGRRMVMSLSEGGGAFFCNSSGISVVNADDGGDFSAFLPDEFVSAVWSPDSQHLALFGLGGLYVVRDGDPAAAVQQVFQSSFNSSASTPVWSPDGTRLAMVVGSAFDVLFVSVLPQPGEPVNLTSFNSMELYPAWSPQGTEIAFVSTSGGSTEIYAVDVETRQLRRLTYNTMNELNLAWLP